MRWRGLASLALLAVLAGCGFHPLYGKSDGSTAAAEETELATVRIDTIADRQGQKLRNFLIDDLQGEGVPPDAKHELVITYVESQADLGLNNDATTTRGQLTIAVIFTLKNIQTGAKEMSSTAQQITGYNIQNSEFATILSRDDAEDRALHAIADNIQLRLAFYFRNVRLGRKTAPDAPLAPAAPAPAMTPFAPHAPGETLDNSSPITQEP